MKFLNVVVHDFVIYYATLRQKIPLFRNLADDRLHHLFLVDFIERARLSQPDDPGPQYGDVLVVHFLGDVARQHRCADEHIVAFRLSKNALENVNVELEKLGAVGIFEKEQRQIAVHDYHHVLALFER